MREIEKKGIRFDCVLKIRNNRPNNNSIQIFPAGYGGLIFGLSDEVKTELESAITPEEVDICIHKHYETKIAMGMLIKSRGH